MYVISVWKIYILKCILYSCVDKFISYQLIVRYDLTIFIPSHPNKLLFPINDMQICYSHPAAQKCSEFTLKIRNVLKRMKNHISNFHDF